LKPIHVNVRFDKINTVSDRTARELLKSLSKICRRAQARELFDLLSEADIEDRERQSLRDRTRKSVETAPVYYLNSAQTGSFIITVTITGFCLWVLQNTLGETLKTAWKETKMHEMLNYYITYRRDKKLPDVIADEAKKYDVLPGRVIVNNTRIEEKRTAIIVHITMSPTEEFQLKTPERVTERMLLANGEARIQALQDTTNR
jgi:hypothetical protein